MNVILIVPQMDDDIRMFSYEDDFGDLDEIPLISSGDQLVSGRGTSTTQTQTKVSRFVCHDTNYYGYQESGSLCLSIFLYYSQS